MYRIVHSVPLLSFWCSQDLGDSDCFIFYIITCLSLFFSLSVLLEIWRSDGAFHRTSSLFHWLFYYFSLSILFYLLPLSFIVSFIQLAFSSFCSSFFVLLRWNLKLLVWDLTSFLTHAFSTIKFNLSTSWASFHEFWHVVVTFFLFSRSK